VTGEASVIADLLPAAVVAAESFGPPRYSGLFPAEAAAVASANPARRLEFAAGRAVARAALAGLGAPVGPVLPGRGGEPRWPDGVVGSITHCAGYRACAVAPARDMTAVGIDAEPRLALGDGLLDAVAGDAERGWLKELSAAVPGIPWDRLLFCAKEAAYKACYPHTGGRLDPRSVTIQISTAGTFAAVRPRASAPDPISGHLDGRPLARLTGRWLAGSELIVTAVSVPR
jgi:4'-phosphopantetheinyl transferase EntD